MVFLKQFEATVPKAHTHTEVAGTFSIKKKSFSNIVLLSILNAYMNLQGINRVAQSLNYLTIPFYDKACSREEGLTFQKAQFREGEDMKAFRNTWGSPCYPPSSAHTPLG